MYRYACSLGLMVPYRNIAEVGTIIRMSIALALVPHQRIREGFELIVQYAGEVQDQLDVPTRLSIGRFLQYIRSFWIDRIGPARFSVSNDVNRTNNLVEAWHRRLNAMIGTAHPNFYTFLCKYYCFCLNFMLINVIYIVFQITYRLL